MNIKDFSGILNQPYINDYFEMMKLKGVYSTRKYSFTIFFNYLHENNINFLSLTINEAQEYQSYLMSLTAQNGQAYYTKETVATMINRVKSFYTYLTKRKAILSNPFNEIKRIKLSYNLPKKILNEDDLNKLLEHMKNFHKASDIKERRRLYKVHVISELMYATGMRMHEVINLSEKDIDLDTGMVKIKDTKTKTERSGILNEYACKVLRLYVEKMRDCTISGNASYKNMLFGSRQCIFTMVNNTLKDVCKKLELKKITSHSFRHCLGFHLLKSGCDIRYIQAVLGHRSLKTTQIYTRVDKKDLKNVLDKYHPRTFKKAGEK
jgi:integrase/recombinase XerD